MDISGRRIDGSDYPCHLPARTPADRTTRVVIVKDLGCPCGGTHVADIAEIGIEFEVKSIKVKKNKTKIAYKLAERN